MPKPTKKKSKAQPPKKKTGAQPLADVLSSIPELPPRAGLPARDSIIGVTTPGMPLMPAAAEAAVAPKYRIIHTIEMDEYEKGAAPLEFAVAEAVAKPKGNSFKGKSRKAAKLSIAKAQTEKFDDLKDLIQSLPAESAMKFHIPPIGTDSKSKRVKEEERNVQVSAFIYAASREDDNDFHLIIGRDPQATPEIYMTMELSGLPPSSSASFKQLKRARDAFKKFYDDNLGGELPGTRYDFPDPPIPVEIRGSLFFDMTHATGSRPGPKSLKSRMPVIWEVHPITRMVFEP